MGSNTDGSNSWSSSSVRTVKEEERGEAQPPLKEGGSSTRRKDTHIPKVLCRLRWQTSPPQTEGFVRPIWAFRFAPSR
jgi:hypothetical protein